MYLVLMMRRPRPRPPAAHLHPAVIKRIVVLLVDIIQPKLLQLGHCRLPFVARAQGEVGVGVRGAEFVALFYVDVFWRCRVNR